MKKSIIAIAAALAVFAGAAHADTSVNLYGLVDAGVTYVDNQATGANTHSSNVRMDSGVMNGNRWGLRGREELGNGLAGIFRVESGFSLDNGTSAQGGRLFGRQAFLGLDIADVGVVSFGRQYDFMANIGDNAIMGNQYGTSYTENNFHYIDRVGGARVDNSIKFSSANFGGFTFGAMAGLGETAGNKAANRTVSAALGFKGVPNLAIDAAYTRINGSTGSNAKGESYGIGATYDLGFGKVNGLATINKGKWNSVLDATLSAANTQKKFNSYELGYTHKFTPQVSAGIGYQYLDNRTTGQKKADMQGVSVAADYAFSKRTDAYGVVVYQKAKSDGVNTLPVDITGSGASSDKDQMAVRVGVRHRF